MNKKENKRDYILVVRVTEDDDRMVKILRENGLNISAYIRKCLRERYNRERVQRV
jgi:post-segregation antitoxin (ccd killing protein)